MKRAAAKKRTAPPKPAPATTKKKAKKRPATRPRQPSAHQLGERRARFRRILAGLRRLYPQATCALNHDSALMLLIAAVLSAQSTDETVNRITPLLFTRFPAPRDLAKADPAAIEGIIYPTGFFRQKTKSIQAACRAIVEQFHGTVPDSMDALLTLPGVARKTGNVVLGTWFGKNEGVVVDTHVGRLAHRLDLTWSSRDSKDATKIENDLMHIIPRKEWTFAAHALIWHGRRVCTARKPNCAECLLAADCPSAFRLEKPPAKSPAAARGGSRPGRRKAAKNRR